MTGPLEWLTGWVERGLLNPLGGLVVANVPVPRAAEVDTGRLVALLLGTGLVIGGVCGGLALAHRLAHDRRYRSPETVFRGLCKLHGLDGATRRLLRRVARHYRLAHPGCLFVEPKWLDPTRLVPSFRAQAAELERLRHEIFYVQRTAAESPAKTRGDEQPGP